MQQKAEAVTTTQQQLWNEYRRAADHSRALERERDAMLAAYEAAETRQREAWAAETAAYDVYLQAWKDAAVIAAAESVAFAGPLVDFTD
jgi:hypothetical protein